MIVPELHAHHTAVVQILAEGRVVPFLGAGVNRAGGATCRIGVTGLPDGTQLRDFLAEKGGFGGNGDDLLRTAQRMSTLLGEGELYLRVRQALAPEATPTPVHRFLAGIPSRLRATRRSDGLEEPNLLLVTTNYDDALECAFQEAGEPYDLVTYVARGDHAGTFEHLVHGETQPRLIVAPNEYGDVSPARRCVILKLHGAIDREDAAHDSFVITEDDYIDYLANADAAGILPVTLAAKLKSSHLLFLGYGLKDWNLRVILRRLWGAHRLDYTSWAIQRGPDRVEKLFWSPRGVEIYDVELQRYVAELSEALGVYLGERPPDDEPIEVAS
jgi:hypothetical protein